MDIVGHRGARGLFPENTLEGFRDAAALGVTMFELDVGMTADGVVVVCHDPALNPDIARDGAGRWLASPGPLIHTLTSAMLAGYDIGRLRPGSPADRLFPEQRPHDGARVPTLEAVLAALPDARFLIEVKTDPAHPERTADPAGLADAVLTVIDGAAATGRVIVEAFDWRVQRYVQRVRPDIRLAWLTRAATPRQQALWWDLARPPDAIASVAACIAAARGTAARGTDAWGAGAGGLDSGPVWAPEHTDLTKARVQRAHDLGLSVMPWTVNRQSDMVRLIDWGVDGLISDRPDVALRILHRGGPDR